MSEAISGAVLELSRMSLRSSGYLLSCDFDVRQARVDVMKRLRD
jgi:hypothetical protein